MKGIKDMIDKYVTMYVSGFLSVSECIAKLDVIVQSATVNIPDIDNRIRQQNKLYKYALSNLVKAINRTERL